MYGGPRDGSRSSLGTVFDTTAVREAAGMTRGASSSLSGGQMQRLAVWVPLCRVRAKVASADCVRMQLADVYAFGRARGRAGWAAVVRRAECIARPDR